MRKLGEIIPASDWFAHRVSKEVFNELQKHVITIKVQNQPTIEIHEDINNIVVINFYFS